MDGGEKLYRIGELSRRSGVPSKTIRFYSDIGVLPPSGVEDSGYRLYSDADHARLSLIRTLRDIGVDLPTISSLLHRKVSAESVLSMQLEIVDMELRTLRRQQALLRAALLKGEGAALTYLEQTRALARLNALERERFLGSHLERAFDGVTVDATWKANFWQAAVLDLPAELSEEQAAAWLELAELVADEDFIRRLNSMARVAWNRPSAEGWGDGLNQIYGAALDAIKDGAPPDSSAAQAIVDAYLAFNGRMMGVDAHDPALPEQIMRVVEQNSDPRAARYWELIRIVRNWPDQPAIGAAHDWLMAGLAWRITQRSRAT